MIPGFNELLARLFYQMLYYGAIAVWNILRVVLSIAEFIQGIELGLVANVSVFVEYMTNALNVPVGIFLILAVTGLGTWYVLNNIVATKQWVDPSKLILYGLLTLLFFAAPATYIESLEGIRTSLVTGIDYTLIDDSVGDLFNVAPTGTGSGYDDVGMPAAIPDLNADGAIATFDLAGFFLAIQNTNEIHRSIFPDQFADTYFPNTPSEIDLSSEAERNAAIESANQGLTTLLLSFFVMPAAIAEHTLWLGLTIAALLIYIGLPIAMMLSFFIFTESLFANYIRQFIKLMIETLLSTLFAGFAIGLVSLASQVGTAVYIAACLTATVVFIWRIIGALKLASNAFDLFGGGSVTGGANMKELRQTAQTAIGLGVGAAALGGAGVLLLDNKAGKAIAGDDMAVGGVLGTNRAKTDNRVKQLQTLAGYGVGKNKIVRKAIENAHEARTFARNFAYGGSQPQEPNALDFLRAGSAASNFGSSPWLAMRMSPSLRKAMDTVGGQTNGFYYDEQAPVGTGSNPIAQLNENISRLIEAINGQGSNSVQNVNIVGRNHDADGDGTDDDLEQGEGNRGQNTAVYTPNQQTARQSREIMNPNPSSVADTAVSPATFAKVDSSSPITSEEISSETQQGIAPNNQNPQIVTGQNTPSVSISSNQGGDAHTTAVSQTIQTLGQQDVAQQTAAHNQLAQAVGPETASLVQTAVQEAGSEQVTLVVQTSINIADQLAAAGKNDSEILKAFQSGEAMEQIQTHLPEESPLTHDQLHAITDMALQPTRDVSPQALGNALGQALEKNGNEADVAHALGSQMTDMSSITGEIRGVLASAQRLSLTAADMRQVAAQLEQNLTAQVHQLLSSKPGSPSEKEKFINNLSSLQQINISMIQTTNPKVNPDA